MIITKQWNVEQGTQEWLQLRLGIVTASEVKKLFTANFSPANNETSRRYEHSLLAQRLSGLEEEQFVTADMANGMLYEPIARDLYSQALGRVEEIGFMTRQLSTTHCSAVIGYSPDGLVNDDGLIEIKTRKPDLHIATILKCEVPREFMLQIQTGLLVSGRKWCDYISCSPGLPLYTHRVKPDIDLQQKITERVLQAEAAIIEAKELYMSTAGTVIVPKIEELWHD